MIVRESLSKNFKTNVSSPQFDAEKKSQEIEARMPRMQAKASQAQLKCPYEDAKSRPSHDDESVTSTQTDGTPSSTNNGCTTISASRSSDAAFNLSPLIPLNTDGSAGSPLNLLHLELMFFWTRDLYKSFLINFGGTRTYADICLNQGLRHPFLMRQILATSALSMSLVKHDRREYYHQHAVQLQSEALSGFNVALKDLSEDNIVAAFLVSSLVGIHSFCETFSFRDEHFNNTLDAFIGCVKLLRGVRSLIGSWWPFLMSSELYPILEVAHNAREQIRDHSHRLDTLRELIQTADIGATSRKAYGETIEELEQVYASQKQVQDPEAGDRANMIFAWLVLTPKEYVELLAQRRPEALIILAYYAVVLHRRRRFWAIDDAGRFLISGISTHLGKHWDQWLSTPNSILQADDPE